MRELSKEEILMLSGGKNIFSKVLNIVAGSLITGITEGFVGFMVAGPFFKGVEIPLPPLFQE